MAFASTGRTGAFNVPSVIQHNQVTLQAAAVQLSVASVPIVSVTIENPAANNVVYVGGAGVNAGNGYRIWPGATQSFDINDLNKIYVFGTATQVVSYLAVA